MTDPDPAHHESSLDVPALTPGEIDPHVPLDALATPALLVDRARLETNIATVADAMARAGVALRPHVKTSKCWQVARRQLESGAIGFTCSTPAEVGWLLDHGVDDLFWAHLPVGPAKIEFAVAAAATGRVLIEVDSLAVAEPIAERAAAEGVVVPFLLEINSGQSRTGADPDAALEILDALADRPSLRVRGITTHEGQLTAVREADERGRVGREVGAGMVTLADRLRDGGHRIDIVSVGSTPGAASVPWCPGVTEARPGTYVYSDLTQIRLGSGRLEDAALTVLARVVNASRDGRVIIDAGTKAMSMDAHAALGGLGRVCDLQLSPLPEVVFEQGNEEHGYLVGPGTAALAVGDLVRIVPNHACGTENMWSRVHVVDEGGEHPGVSEVWPVEARY